MINNKKQNKQKVETQIKEAHKLINTMDELFPKFYCNNVFSGETVLKLGTLIDVFKEELKKEDKYNEK